jgi:hypothetical protein
MTFRVVTIEKNDQGAVVGRNESLALFGRREDAAAIAEFRAAWTGECGYDSERGCWWARDHQRTFTFIVEPVPIVGAA